MEAPGGVEPPTPAFFRADFSRVYLLILQDIALKTSLFLSFLLEPKWSQVVKI
jgi:hypothetical protein